MTGSTGWASRRRGRGNRLACTGDRCMNVLEADHAIILVNAQHLQGGPGTQDGCERERVARRSAAAWLTPRELHPTAAHPRAARIDPLSQELLLRSGRKRSTACRRSWRAPPASSAPSRPTSWARVDGTCSKPSWRGGERPTRSPSWRAGDYARSCPSCGRRSTDGSRRPIVCSSSTRLPTSISSRNPSPVSPPRSRRPWRRCRRRWRSWRPFPASATPRRRVSSPRSGSIWAGSRRRATWPRGLASAPATGKAPANDWAGRRGTATRGTATPGCAPSWARSPGRVAFHCPYRQHVSGRPLPSPRPSLRQAQGDRGGVPHVARRDLPRAERSPSLSGPRTPTPSTSSTRTAYNGTMSTAWSSSGTPSRSLPPQSPERTLPRRIFGGNLTAKGTDNCGRRRTKDRVETPAIQRPWTKVDVGERAVMNPVCASGAATYCPTCSRSLVARAWLGFASQSEMLLGCIVSLTTSTRRTIKSSNSVCARSNSPNAATVRSASYFRR